MPTTPPRERESLIAQSKLAGPKLDNQLSPAKSDVDSGVEDMFGSPLPKTKQTERKHDASRPTASVSQLDLSEKDASDTLDRKLVSEATEHAVPGIVKAEEKMPENPFDNPLSRRQFEAIDELQSWGSNKYLSIPQVSPGGHRTMRFSSTYAHAACHRGRPVIGKVISPTDSHPNSIPRGRGLLYPLSDSHRLPSHWARHRRLFPHHC